MTGVGAARTRYAAQVERRPSRFADPPVYREWCTRADTWAVTS